MIAATILFPFGVRLSTWVMLAVFVGIAVSRRDLKPLMAGWTWMWGFEAAYGAASLLFRPGPHDYPLYMILGIFTLVWMTRAGVRPSLPVLAASLAVMVVWIALGFHQNFHTATVIAPGTEVLNEATKTLWAVAYLLPLLRNPMPRADRAAAYPKRSISAGDGQAAGHTDPRP